MACPYYLQRGHRCRCLAVVGEVVPTLYEREVFCWTRSHESCPTLVANMRKGRPLSEDEYVEQWTGQSVGVANRAG